MSLQNTNLVANGVTYDTVGLFELVQSGLSYSSDPITPPSGVNYNSTAYNIRDGHLYAGQGNKVWRIKSDGKLELVGTPGTGFASGYVGDMDDNNKYYLQSGGATSLHVVDLANPNAYTVLPVTLNGAAKRMNGADIAFNPRDGYIYVKGSGHEILKIDRDTGVAEVFYAEASSPTGAAGGAWFDAAGFFYNYFNSGSIYRYDLENPNDDGSIPASFFAPSFKVRTNDGAACAYRPTLTKSVTPNPGTPGQPVTYSFNLFNVLPEAISVNFEDQLSGFPGATWTSAIGGCSAVDANGTSNAALCNGLTLQRSNSNTKASIANIRVPARGRISFSLTVNTSASLTPAEVCNQAQISNIRPDGSVFDARFSSLTLKSDDTGPAGLEDPTCHTFGKLELGCSLADSTNGIFTPGQSTIIDLELTSSGTASASQISVREILQSSALVTNNAFSPDKIQCTTAGTTSSSSCGSQIVAANRQSYELRDLALSAQSGGTNSTLKLRIPISFDAGFSADSFTLSPEITIGGEDFSSLCGSLEMKSDPKADLSVSKASYTGEADLALDQPQSLYTPGETTLYVVTVSNDGPSNVVNADWQDDLPVGFAFSGFEQTCSCNRSGACTASASGPAAGNVLSGKVSVPAGCEVQMRFEGAFSAIPQ